MSTRSFAQKKSVTYKVLFVCSALTNINRTIAFGRKFFYPSLHETYYIVQRISTGISKCSYVNWFNNVDYVINNISFLYTIFEICMSVVFLGFFRFNLDYVLLLTTYSYDASTIKNPIKRWVAYSYVFSLQVIIAYMTLWKAVEGKSDSELWGDIFHCFNDVMKETFASLLKDLAKIPLFPSLIDKITFGRIQLVEEQRTEEVRTFNPHAVKETAIITDCTGYVVKLSQQVFGYKPTIRSHPITYRKQTRTPFITTGKDVFTFCNEEDKSNRSLQIRTLCVGVSGLIPVSEKCDGILQEDVAMSQIGHVIGQAHPDWKLFLQSPIFSISYVHRNHLKHSLSKVDPTVWRNLNEQAAFLTKSLGFSHYMLWTDSVLRFRNHNITSGEHGGPSVCRTASQTLYRDEESGIQIDSTTFQIPKFSSDGDSPWYVYGLLPYLFFYTLIDEAECQVAQGRYWPYIESKLSGVNGKLYMNACNVLLGMGNQQNLSHATVMRVVSLMTKVHDSSLKVTFEEDAKHVQQLFEEIATGDYGQIEYSGSPSISDQQKQMGLDALWIAIHAHDASLIVPAPEKFLNAPRILSKDFDVVQDTLFLKFRSIPRRPGWPPSLWCSPIKIKLFFGSPPSRAPEDCLFAIYCAVYHRLRPDYLGFSSDVNITVLPYAFLIFQNQEGEREIQVGRHIVKHFRPQLDKYYKTEDFMDMVNAT